MTWSYAQNYVPAATWEAVAARWWCLHLPPLLCHCGAKVSHHYFFSEYEHVSLIAPRVGSSALLEDHNGVLHVPVHEIKSEVGATGHPTCTSINQEVNGRFHPPEVNWVLLRPMDPKWLQ